jgi:hypothetical protein
MKLAEFFVVRRRAIRWLMHALCYKASARRSKRKNRIGSLFTVLVGAISPQDFALVEYDDTRRRPHHAVSLPGRDGHRAAGRCVLPEGIERAIGKPAQSTAGGVSTSSTSGSNDRTSAIASLLISSRDSAAT